MDLKLFPAMPGNPFAVREATIEWSHQLAAQQAADVAAAQADALYQQRAAAAQTERLDVVIPTICVSEPKPPTNRGKNFAQAPRAGTRRTIGGQHDNLPDRRARGHRRTLLDRATLDVGLLDFGDVVDDQLDD